MRRRALFKLAGAAAAASPASSLAQGFPSRAISLVVPYPAGGPTDTLTRIMGEAMQRPLGQSVLVENITGASGAVAATAVSVAPRTWGGALGVAVAAVVVAGWLAIAVGYARTLPLPPEAVPIARRVAGAWGVAIALLLARYA